ncbi:histidine phosphatase family protein [Skermania sp. ID1734]|uniref:SixA phosphatase family protein n=1 Tax=Skermania sp. ID1734 TaxID=2597516 RepID=UPI00117F8D17|nr:histidine phosphatase family protein [Skermania sp. ID1734]TSD95076.1 histidine phosphatase family protein [Skermania sp. ID1734]
MPRSLILMRHGKSAYPLGVIDHDRPLAARGERQAALAGEWLRAHQPPIDAVLCSTAARTRETLAATGIDTKVSFEPSIYEAGIEQLIELIRLTDDSVQTLLVVGHAPGIPWTAWELAANRDSPHADALSAKFPTSAMAVLAVDDSWSGLGTGLAELVDFHIPR